MQYNYVTSFQVERTNELIVENNELLSNINNSISLGFNTIGFILVFFVMYKVVRHILGVKNG